MQYLDSDLGYQSAGAIVDVHLKGTEANVMLLDQTNFQHYRAQRDFRYVGGHFKQSPVVLQVPHPGHWHAVVDLGGSGGRVEASVTVRS